MKLDITDDKIIVFLNKMIIKNMDFKNKKVLESNLKSIFQTINKNYNIKIQGCYTISIYIDKQYGIILDVEKEELDYQDYYDNQIDMRISLIDQSFIYEIDNPFDYKNIGKMYYYQDKIYLTQINDLTNIEMAKLLEHSNIIYNNVEEIIYKGKRLLFN